MNVFDPINGGIGSILPPLGVGSVNIKVTPQELVDKSAEVKDRVVKMRKQFEELKVLVDKTKSYWIGEGGDLNRKLYEDLQPEVEEILKRLEEHPSDLIKIAQKYSDVELKIQQEIEALPGDIIV